MLKKMITFILSLVMVFLTTWAVQAQGVIKFSADLSGSVETNYLQKNTWPVDPGYLVGIEFFQQKQEETLLGAGVEYQLLRYAENLDEEFGFIPLLSQEVNLILSESSGTAFFGLKSLTTTSTTKAAYITEEESG